MATLARGLGGRAQASLGQTGVELGSIPNTPVLLTPGLRQPPDSSVQKAGHKKHTEVHATEDSCMLWGSGRWERPKSSDLPPYTYSVTETLC